MKVKIKKLSAVANAKYLTPSKEDFDYGENNEGVSIPVEYTVTGELLNRIEMDRSICVLRENRNGIDAVGYFTTSRVKNIVDIEGGLRFDTENSVYELEWLD